MSGLNSEQQPLFEKIVGLQFNKLLLLGNAGCGKTYVLCKALSELVRRGNLSLVLCAPTHLARLNILGKLDPDVQHLAETCTVASLLSKFGVDSNDGTVRFTAGNTNRVEDYKLIAIDECSMISEQDYILLMTAKAKIIFTGDFKQLPPVMAKSAEERIDRHMGTGNLEVIRLTQQMRQHGVIHAAAERNRSKAWFPERTEVGDNGESITVHGTVSGLINAMTNNLLSDPRGYDATHHHRYIAYKNNTVRGVGKAVRDKVLGNYFGFDTKTVPFICSEIIMMRENKSGIGYNGELVEIVRAKRDPDAQKFSWDSYELMVKGSMGTGLIRTIPPCQQPLLEDFIDTLQSKLRRHQIEGDKESAERTLKAIKRTRAHWIKTQYPYAVTTHKSQGSTIENVYLDTLSFVKAPNKRALLYVGISRASKSLHTIRVPEDKKQTVSEVNSDYREARLTYQLLTGKSYGSVLRRMGFCTRTAEGKAIAAGYLWAMIDDIKQQEG